MSDDEKGSSWPAWLTWDVVWPRLCRVAALGFALNDVLAEKKVRPETVALVVTFLAVPIAGKIDRDRREREDS